MASSSTQGDPAASAGPSKPRSNPWASTSTPPAKPAWGASAKAPSSSSTSAGFPTLSSSSHPTRKRDRGTPWKPAPRQSYPSRLQEIQARALERRAREDEEALLAQTGGEATASSPPRMMTLDELNGSAADEGEGQGEDADFYRGPAQMYGMSRVVVRDLSEAGPGKGKGRNKARGQDVTGGPQVYARHNAPWVQRAKRGREEGGVGGDEVAEESASRREQESAEARPVVHASTITLSLEEVVTAFHRATRIQAARRRAKASSSSPSADPLEAVLEKLRYDVEIGEPLSLAPTVLASLPQDEAARCITAIVSSITASAPRHSPATLWQLLRLCLSLDFDSDEAVEETRSAWQAVLHALHAHGADAKPTDLQDEEARSLVARLLVPLNAGIAQAHRLSGPPPLLGHLAHAFHLLRLAHPCLPAATFYCSQLDDPRALDVLRSLDQDDDGSTYAFLLPLSTTKLRLVSREAERIAEEARKQRLWASFYHAGSRNGEDRYASPHLRVRRTHVLEDTLSSLHDLHNDLAWQHGAHLNVTFEGEEGVDSVLGGLRREWLSLLVAEPVRLGVVREAEEGGVVVLSEEASESHATLLGLTVGMGLLLGVPCGLRLGRGMVRWLLSEGNQPDEARTLEDLDEAYPTLGRNLRAMLDWQPVEGGTDADATFQRIFSLNWTAVSPISSLIVPLVSGGQHRPVTLTNRHAYAQALAQHRLYGSVRAQFDGARQGFSMAWPARSRAWLRAWLAEEELASLVEGPTSIDVGLLRRLVQVVNPRRSGEDASLLETWWNAVETLQQEDEAFTAKLLAFITGSPRLPLSFLAATSEGARLSAPFAIHLVDEDSIAASSVSLPLPWASTCTMTLFLPRSYAKVGVEELVERLRRSVELGVEGFGLK